MWLSESRITVCMRTPFPTTQRDVICDIDNMKWRKESIGVKFLYVIEINLRSGQKQNVIT